MIGEQLKILSSEFIQIKLLEHKPWIYKNCTSVGTELINSRLNNVYESDSILAAVVRQRSNIHTATLMSRTKKEQALKTLSRIEDAVNGHIQASLKASA
jgi:hypothetical protein